MLRIGRLRASWAALAVIASGALVAVALLETSLQTPIRLVLSFFVVTVAAQVLGWLSRKRGGISWDSRDDEP